MVERHLEPLAAAVRNILTCLDQSRKMEATLGVASDQGAKKTGVEMEALIARSVALLTIYDMCKAVDRGLTIGGVRFMEKRGMEEREFCGAFVADDAASSCTLPPIYAELSFPDCVRSAANAPMPLTSQSCECLLASSWV